MTSASLSTSFKVAVPKTFTNDMFQFELCSGEIDVAPTIKYSHTDAAAETAQDDEQVAEPTDTEVKESDPAGNLPAVGGAAAPLSAQLLQNNPEDANELTIEIEPLMLTFHCLLYTSTACGDIFHRGVKTVEENRTVKVVCFVRGGYWLRETND